MGETTDNPYRRDAVMTATPEQLHLMLYDGAIRNALQARDAIEAKDYETSYERLTKAQHIILEMQNGLNYDVNRELCERVASIYGFLYRKLVDACINRNISDIDDALKVLRYERETWQMLVEKVSRIREGAHGGQHDHSRSDTNDTVPVAQFATQAGDPTTQSASPTASPSVADTPVSTAEEQAGRSDHAGEGVHIGFSAEG